MTKMKIEAVYQSKEFLFCMF